MAGDSCRERKLRGGRAAARTRRSVRARVEVVPATQVLHAFLACCPFDRCVESELSSAAASCTKKSAWCCKLNLQLCEGPRDKASGIAGPYVTLGALTPSTHHQIRSQMISLLLLFLLLLLLLPLLLRLAETSLALTCL